MLPATLATLFLCYNQLEDKFTTEQQYEFLNILSTSKQRDDRTCDDRNYRRHLLYGFPGWREST